MSQNSTRVFSKLSTSQPVRDSLSKPPSSLASSPSHRTMQPPDVDDFEEMRTEFLTRGRFRTTVKTCDFFINKRRSPGQNRTRSRGTFRALGRSLYRWNGRAFNSSTISRRKLKWSWLGSNCHSSNPHLIRVSITTARSPATISKCHSSKCAKID